MSAMISTPLFNKLSQENADLSARLEIAKTALKLSAVRLEILVGRMRGCNEVTGKHELLDEGESFIEEAKESLQKINGDKE